MLRTIEATIEGNGKVKLAEAVKLRGRKRALVTILDEDWPEDESPNEAALLSEAALAKDWLGAEADRAWEHLAGLPDLDAVAKRGKRRK